MIYHRFIYDFEFILLNNLKKRYLNHLNMKKHLCISVTAKRVEINNQLLIMENTKINKLITICLTIHHQSSTHLPLRLVNPVAV